MVALHRPDGVTNSGWYFYHQDDQGNVVALVNALGSVVERVRYLDGGEPRILDSNYARRTASEYGNPYYFTGRRWDAETGFYYFRHRYYDPTLGRFTTRDPIGIWGDALNLGNGSTYAGNNPWSYVDPFGLERCATIDDWMKETGLGQQVADHIMNNRIRDLTGTFPFEDLPLEQQTAAVEQTRGEHIEVAEKSNNRAALVAEIAELIIREGAYLDDGLSGVEGVQALGQGDIPGAVFSFGAGAIPGVSGGMRKLKHAADGAGGGASKSARINWNRQNKHTTGHRHHTPGRSEMTHPNP